MTWLLSICDGGESRDPPIQRKLNSIFYVEERVTPPRYPPMNNEQIGNVKIELYRSMSIPEHAQCGRNLE